MLVHILVSWLVSALALWIVAHHSQSNANVSIDDLRVNQQGGRDYARGVFDGVSLECRIHCDIVPLVRNSRETETVSSTAPFLSVRPVRLHDN